MLLILYIVAIVLPVGLAALLGSLEGDVWRMAALASGMVALAILLLQFICSGRIGLVSRRAGIDRTMRFHQWAAYAALLLALLHPLLFAMPPGGDWAGVLRMMEGLVSTPLLATGGLALVCLLLLVPVSVFRRRLPARYEVWRASHLLLAIAAAAFGLHHTFAVGTSSANGWSAAYWYLLLGLAIAAITVVHVVMPLRRRHAAYQVKVNREAGFGIRELVLEATGGRRFKFEAGQFAWVLIGQPPVALLDHPFSISSAPEELPDLRLLIKARGDFTATLPAVAAGTRVYLDGPHGNFTLRDRRGDAIVLVAGGIGIAPIMSLLRHLSMIGDRRPIALVFGARSPAQLVHAEEIAGLSGSLDLRVQFFVDEPPASWSGGVGAIDRAALRDALRLAPARCLCFICGPTPMMLACEGELRQLGVPSTQIVFERFDYD